MHTAAKDSIRASATSLQNIRYSKQKAETPANELEDNRKTGARATEATIVPRPLLAQRPRPLLTRRPLPLFNQRPSPPLVRPRARALVFLKPVRCPGPGQSFLPRARATVLATTRDDEGPGWRGWFWRERRNGRLGKRGDGCGHGEDEVSRIARARQRCRGRGITAPRRRRRCPPGRWGPPRGPRRRHRRRPWSRRRRRRARRSRSRA